MPFKKLILTSTIFLSLISPAQAQTEEIVENWKEMGKTNNGSVLMLDVSSPQNKPHAGHWLWFSYKIRDSLGTREFPMARTGSCKKGKIFGSPEWKIDKLDPVSQTYDGELTIKADSPGSLALMKAVCASNKENH